MHSRILPMEESKDGFVTTRTNQSRVAPQRMLQFLVLFLVMCVTFSVVSVYLIRHFGAQNIVAATGLKTNIFQCVEEANTTLARWTRGPSNLLHTMSDKELFWLASLVPRRKEYPFTRVPKIAFMFLTKGPLPLAPLWERFFSGHDRRYSLYIHSLPSFVPNFPSSSVFYKRQIPSEVAEWGKMSMCDAERRLLANALLDVSNEWFVLLSESCVPLYNFSVIYHYIKKSKYSFIGAFDDPGPYGRGRYNYMMAPEVEITHWRKGSQWFEINRKLAIHIVEDTTFYPKFTDFCKPACYVDEHYFPTMLTILAPNLLANRSVTWTDWSRGGAHPATFGRGDITEDFMKKIYEVHVDSEPGPYECSDPDHCDNGVDCEGLHNYSEEYIRLTRGKHDLSQSVNKSENTIYKSVDKSVEKSVSSVDKSKHATLNDDVVVDEPPLVEKSVSSVCPDIGDLPGDDDDYVSDSEDACSFS